MQVNDGQRLDTNIRHGGPRSGFAKPKPKPTPHHHLHHEELENPGYRNSTDPSQAPSRGDILPKKVASKPLKRRPEDCDVAEAEVSQKDEGDQPRWRKRPARKASRKPDGFYGDNSVDLEFEEHRPHCTHFEYLLTDGTEVKASTDNSAVTFYLKDNNRCRSTKKDPTEERAGSVDLEGGEEAKSTEDSVGCKDCTFPRVKFSRKKIKALKEAYGKSVGYCLITPDSLKVKNSEFVPGGKGLFATQLIKKGTVIGSYDCPTVECDSVKSQNAYTLHPPGVDKDYTFNGEDRTRSSYTRFINDGSQPVNGKTKPTNCKFVPHVRDDGNIIIEVVTRTEVAPGKELFVEYGARYWQIRKSMGLV